jgi:hypothetical protein
MVPVPYVTAAADWLDYSPGRPSTTKSSEMIMSTHSFVLGAHGPGPVVGATRGIRTLLSGLIGAVLAHQLKRADRDVRTVLDPYSAERLAEYGWSAGEIRRLKSR